MKKHSEATKKKISKKMKGRILTPEWRAKISKTLMGNSYQKIGEEAFMYKGDKATRVSTYRIRARRKLERAFDIKITSENVVHHLDHNHKNNNFDNLFVFRNQATHLKYHAYLRKVVYHILGEC